LIGAFLTAIYPLMAQSGRVLIRVTDLTGNVIPRAQVALLRPDDKPLRTEQADDMGDIVWTDLPIGESRISVASRGFATRRLVVTVRNSDGMKVDAQLEVGRGVMVYTSVAHSDSPSEVGKPPRPKRHWWQILR